MLEFKLNSIYAEEESRCYVPLVCCHCQETRGPRSRINVVAVRAVICGNESSQGSSPVRNNKDKGGRGKKEIERIEKIRKGRENDINLESGGQGEGEER